MFDWPTRFMAGLVLVLLLGLFGFMGYLLVMTDSLLVFLKAVFGMGVIASFFAWLGERYD